MAAVCLHWEGKLGLVFGCTGAIDTQHSVGDALGNRFLLLRLGTAENQFAWALKHTGASISIMRRELVASVTQLFNTPRPDPRPLDGEQRIRAAQSGDEPGRAPARGNRTRSLLA